MPSTATRSGRGRRHPRPSVDPGSAGSTTAAAARDAIDHDHDRHDRHDRHAGRPDHTHDGRGAATSGGSSEGEDEHAVGGSAPVPGSAWGDGGRAAWSASGGGGGGAGRSGTWSTWPVFRVVVPAADGSRVGVRRAGSAEGRFHEPRGVAVAPDGTVYVADTGNNRIQHFSAEGDLLGAWGETGSRGQVQRAHRGGGGRRGRVFVVDRPQQWVQVFDGGGRPPVLGRLRAEPGRFANPTGLSIGPDGGVYVADTFNARIQRFTARGTVAVGGSPAPARRRGRDGGGELPVADDAARPVASSTRRAPDRGLGGASEGEAPAGAGLGLDGAGRLPRRRRAVLAYKGDGAGGAASP